MSSLLNKSLIKRAILDIAKRKRSHPFNRVSQEVLTYLERKHLQAIDELVKYHPSKGRTIKFPNH